MGQKIHLNFSRYCQNALQRGSVPLHLHQHSMRVLLSWYPCEKYSVFIYKPKRLKYYFIIWCVSSTTSEDKTLSYFSSLSFLPGSIAHFPLFFCSFTYCFVATLCIQALCIIILLSLCFAFVIVDSILCRVEMFNY